MDDLVYVSIAFESTYQTGGVPQQGNIIFTSKRKNCASILFRVVQRPHREGLSIGVLKKKKIFSLISI